MLEQYLFGSLIVPHLKKKKKENVLLMYQMVPVVINPNDEIQRIIIENKKLILETLLVLERNFYKMFGSNSG